MKAANCKQAAGPLGAGVAAAAAPPGYDDEYLKGYSPFDDGFVCLIHSLLDGPLLDLQRPSDDDDDTLVAELNDAQIQQLELHREAIMALVDHFATIKYRGKIARRSRGGEERECRPPRVLPRVGVPV